MRNLVHAGTLMSEDQRSVVFEVADGIGWHEVGKWRARHAAQGLDGVLPPPAWGRGEGRARM